MPEDGHRLLSPPESLSSAHTRNSCSVFRHTSDVAGGARAARWLVEWVPSEPITCQNVASSGDATRFVKANRPLTQTHTEIYNVKCCYFRGDTKRKEPQYIEDKGVIFLVWFQGFPEGWCTVEQFQLSLILKMADFGVGSIWKIQLLLRHVL